MATADADAGQTSEILASIQGGAMIQIFYGSGEGVSPAQFPGTDQMVLSLVDGYPQTVLNEAYEFDGAMSAKTQIQDQASGLFWQQGQTIKGLPNPILLGPPPGEGFTLTDTGGGRLTLQTEQTPPPPFVRPGPVPGQSGFWFTFGFADPGRGRYTIQVVG